MWLAARKLVSAIFNGAPNDEVDKYTTQTTSLIALYVCLVTIFIVGLYVRRLHLRPPANSDRKNALLSVSYAMMAAVGGTAIYIIYFLAANG